ncbi:hypothetical protein [Halonotius pteroides]|uniref:DUF5673 domain-containing protein n=1 Tax=Halonotius pteroides TaxID=268735 RepID=A0A3A6PXY8_9EURY|nr:hypothetical protein [Halonotius pteroides]RJX48321.1 hypothetical protein DP106_12415 [Halonotius pteroides]
MDGRRLIEALLGVYVATLLLPTLAVTGWVAVTSASFGTILAAGLAIAGATALAATTVGDLLDRVASLPAAAALTLPPLAYIPYMIIADIEAEAVVTIAGLFALVPGIAVLLAAAGIRNRRLRARATEHAVVTIGDGDDDGISQPVVLAAVGGIGLIVVAAVAVPILTFDGFDGSSTLFTSLTGLSSLFFLFDNDGHELAVTDEGLRVDSSIIPWDDLGSYRLTDEEIKIERACRWLPSRDFDREEIGDDAAFIDALGEYLPRTDEKTEPAAATADR